MDLVRFCSAWLVLLLAALSLNTSRMRRGDRARPGTGGTALDKAIRAQGNAAEYIPLLVALLLFMDVTRIMPAAFLACVAVLATLSRLAHAAGMLRATSATAPHPLRFCGAVGTYASLVLLGTGLLVSAS